MSLKKICRCGKIIDLGDGICTECKSKQQQRTKERHKQYKSNRNDRREQKFYTSKEWLQLKEHLKVKYKGLCLWSYFIDNKIVMADVNHHIEPVKESWNKRLDIYNVIPLSNRMHQIIHKKYETDKEKTQQELRELLFKWKEIEGNGQ